MSVKREGIGQRNSAPNPPLLSSSPQLKLAMTGVAAAALTIVSLTLAEVMSCL